jgi:hypothetical protein
MSNSKEHIHLRFQAVVIASQLPDNTAEALLVLDYARHMVVKFWDDSSHGDRPLVVLFRRLPSMRRP